MSRRALLDRLAAERGFTGSISAMERVVRGWHEPQLVRPAGHMRTGHTAIDEE
ncbi:hypothetical protein HMPREF1316_2016 [Olsenella profusa F0195]|uniref:Uncharacterized protein n=1 Tax=Olsenella profusa F0195 TaxID=1125712 RepID=U2TPX1_9ACTN|nr:hypothetical protein HMPREF1316_2016 [Olsenella profusa F0195]